MPVLVCICMCVCVQNLCLCCRHSPFSFASPLFSLTLACSCFAFCFYLFTFVTAVEFNLSCCCLARVQWTTGELKTAWTVSHSINNNNYRCFLLKFCFPFFFFLSLILNLICHTSLAFLFSLFVFPLVIIHICTQISFDIDKYLFYSFRFCLSIYMHILCTCYVKTNCNNKSFFSPPFSFHLRKV